jgi:hypothetical protein
MRAVVIVDGQDVGVFQTGDELRFSLKAFCRYTVNSNGLVNNLDGDIALHRLLSGAEDSCHTTGTNFFEQLIWPNA